MENSNLIFAGRLAVPTLMMGVATAYWASLLDARMREQNLILIQPVFFFVALCYVLIVIFEIRRFRSLPRTSGGDLSALATHLQFMAVAIIGAVLFPILGAIPATVAVLGGGMIVLGVRHPVTLCATTVLTIAVLWLVFVVGFGMRMTLFGLF